MIMQNYIIVNGKKYCAGSIFVVNCMGQVCDATFIGHNAERESYFFNINNKICRMHAHVFEKSLVSTTTRIDPNVRLPASKQKKELEINGMLLGWMWYIFLMAVSFIFKDVIGLWIAISIIFFTWRSKKIKEEGMYIEW